MLRLKFQAALILAALLSSCAAKPPKAASLGASTASESPPSLEAAEDEFQNLESPLPEDCQAFLDKSKEWNYKPDASWTPKDKEQAEQVLDFFAGFHLVPETSAKSFDKFLARAFPKKESEAEANILEFQKAQICHPSLVIAFIDGLFTFSWSAADREKLAGTWKTFVQNHQNRTAPILIRALELQVLKRALDKNWLRAKKGAASPTKALNKAQEALMSAEASLQERELAASPLVLESLLRDDLQQATDTKDEIQKILSSLRD